MTNKTQTNDFLNIEWATVSENATDSDWPEQAEPTDEELAAEAQEWLAQQAAYLAEEDARLAREAAAEAAWMEEHEGDEDEPFDIVLCLSIM